MIGFSVFAPLSIAGQIFVSVVFDHIGFLGSHRKPLNRWKGLSLCLICGGLAMIVYQALSTRKSLSGGTLQTALLSLAAFATGFLMPFQVALNTLLGRKFAFVAHG
jgi:uncharacterized membrane protein YdcZ (DUF606 family)